MKKIIALSILLSLCSCADSTDPREGYFFSFQPRACTYVFAEVGLRVENGLDGYVSYYYSDIPADSTVTANAFYLTLETSNMNIKD